MKYRKSRKVKNVSLAKIISFSAVGLGLLIALGVAGFMLQSDGDISISDSSSTAQSNEGSSTEVEVIASPDESVEVDDSSSSSTEDDLLQDNSQSKQPSDSSEEPPTTSSMTDAVNTAVSTDEYRAMWVSYLELEGMDLSSAQSFTAEMTKLLDNCVDLGLNTIIFHVRPFGDALYHSTIFPSSHLISGAQGAALPYDPLAIAIELCKSRSLRIEAWINPYRVQLSSTKPSSLSSTNPAVHYLNSNSKGDYVVEHNGGYYYNPAYTEVQDLIVSGVMEIIQKYDVDGIHFDDYFYPTTEPSFDELAYSKLSNGTDLSTWRRENVNSLVQKVYNAIKSSDPSVVFGISPQGNNDNNYNQQYSDVNLWLSTPGYVDYIMPQLYWGFDYLTASGREDYQFARLSEGWAS